MQLPERELRNERKLKITRFDISLDLTDKKRDMNWAIETVYFIKELLLKLWLSR